MRLPLGVFHTLDSVAAHLAFGPKNVALAGRGSAETVLAVSGRLVPRFEEQEELVGRLLVKGLALGRLIPLGGLQTAVDAGGRLCVARTDRLGPYFGIGKLAEGPATSVDSRMLVVTAATAPATGTKLGR